MSTVATEGLRTERRVYQPPEDFSKRAHVGSMEAYRQLYQEAEADPDAFWARAAGDLHWFKRWDKILDWKPPFAKWFLGGELNLAYNCLDQQAAKGRGDKAAILWEGEPGDIRTLTYRQVLAEVSKLANALTTLGVSTGDRIAIYMGMEPELPIAMLACARIGAVHTVIFGDFSSNSIADRIKDCEARVVITQDGTYRHGSEVKLKAAVDTALVSCPSVTDVIVYRRTGTAVNWMEGRDHWWHVLMAEASEEHDAVPVAADHPLFLLYTSGTTGKPKGVLHTVGGYSVGTYLTTKWIFDLKDDDVFWCTADCGWISGHSYLVYGPMQNGATIVMYEGAPTHPHPDRLWDMVDRHKVSVFYTAPTAIRTFMRLGDEWPAKHEMSSLRLLGSVGEPINPEAWLWYRERIGRGRCPIVDTWWQTETGMIMISPLPGATPAKAGSATLPFPGVCADIVTADGTPVPTGTQGFLVVKRLWPAMLATLYGDPERYLTQYWSQIPGTYFTGDGAHKDEDGYFWITGRIDDVMNVSGHRLSSAELEAALMAHPLTAEAAVVSRPDPVKGEVPFAFVVLRSGVQASEALRNDLIQWVGTEIGSFAKPDGIEFVRGLPKTRSGKIVRCLLREFLSQGSITGDTTMLENLSVLSQLMSKTDEDNPGCAHDGRARTPDLRNCHALLRERHFLPDRRPGVRQPYDEGEAMHQVTLDSTPGPYALATGEAAAYRLRLLHGLYGEGTRRVLLDAGLRRGMRAADLGCGVGTVTALLSELVGPEGHVVGIDASAAQLALARERLNGSGANVRFVEASATATGLPPGSFDLVYCRFLLIHLPEPERALAEMRALLKPGGILVCEDGDLTSAGSEPPSALDAFAELWGRLGPRRGVDYTLGCHLFKMVQAAGFPEPEVRFNQPVVARGETKRLLELSVAEAGPAFIEAGLITAEELERTLVEMRRLNADGSVLAVMPRMAQVWARKDTPHVGEGPPEADAFPTLD